MRTMVKCLMSAALLSVTGVASAQCQDMSVIVRDSVYNIRGLDSFCAEFEKLKRDVQALAQKLAEAERSNEALRAALQGRSAPGDGRTVASRQSQ